MRPAFTDTHVHFHDLREEQLEYSWLVHGLEEDEVLGDYGAIRAERYWADDFLAETVIQPPGMDPSTKTRFQMLLSVKEHEMHHRGQLMLMQRIIGLTPHLTRQMEERMAQRAAAAQEGQPVR